MAVSNFESGKAQQLLRAMHLPTCTNIWATYLPWKHNSPVFLVMKPKTASQSCTSEQAWWSEWISVSGHQLTKHGAKLVGMKCFVSSPVSTDFYAKLSQNTLDKTYFCHQTPLLWGHLGLFCPFSVKWNETNICLNHRNLHTPRWHRGHTVW